MCMYCRYVNNHVIIMMYQHVVLHVCVCMCLYCLYIGFVLHVLEGALVPSAVGKAQGLVLVF